MPPDPATTIRGRIAAEIRKRISQLDFVGLVLPPGYRGEEQAKSIARCVTEGLDEHGPKAAVELVIGHDEEVETEASAVELYRFGVCAVIHLPVPPVLDMANQPRTADDLAADYDAQIYKLYAADSDGRWHDGNGITARHTRRLGGGGVEIDPDLGTVCTESAFEVTYGFVRGRPEVAG